MQNNIFVTTIVEKNMLLVPRLDSAATADSTGLPSYVHDICKSTQNATKPTFQLLLKQCYPAVMDVRLQPKLLFPRFCWSAPENHWSSLFFSPTIKL